MIEVAYPSVNMFFWAGLSGPPGIPANTVKILENAAKQVDAVPDVVEKLDKTGLEPFYLSGDAYRKFVFNEAITLKALKLR